MNNDSYLKAIKQTQEVKKLCNRRPKIDLGKIDPYTPPIECKPVLEYPNYRNPIFTAIFARKVKNNSNPSNEEKKIFLNSLKPTFQEKNNPDLIIAGNSNLLIPSIEYSFQFDEYKGRVTTFLLEDSKYNYLSVSKNDIAYGAGFLCLMSAISWIRLGFFPYHKVLNDALKMEKGEIKE